MGKFISFLVILTLLLTGCGTSKNNEKTVSSKIYSYDATYWNESMDKQDDIVNEIMNVWKKNDELYNVNFMVNTNSIKERINEYLENNPEETTIIIFQLASEIVGIDYSSYKVK